MSRPRAGGLRPPGFRAVRLAPGLALGLVLAAAAGAQTPIPIPPVPVGPPPADSAFVPPEPAAPPPAPRQGPPPVLDPLGRTPGGAVRRALVLPGWGQAYNGQPVKAPFAAGAVAGFGGYAVYVQRRYVAYRRAALFAQGQEAPGEGGLNEFERFRPAWEATGQRQAGTLRTIRDNVRGRRDLAVLGVAVAYTLQAVDAFVIANLADFDVGEDLSVGLAPGTEGGAALTLRLRL